MSDKSHLCLACGHSTDKFPDRVGGPGEPYTYHRDCAYESLADALDEGQEVWGSDPYAKELNDEILWLVDALPEKGGVPKIDH